MLPFPDGSPSGRRSPGNRQSLRRRSVGSEEDFNLDDIDGDLGFQPMYGEMADSQGQVSGHAFEPEGSATSALAKVKALLPGNLSAMGGKAMGAVTDGAKDAFKMPSFMSMLAFGNPVSFSKPAGLQEAAKRLRQNVIIYKRNYISTGVLLFFLQIILSPTLLFPLLMVAGGWVWMLSGKEDPEAEPVMFGPVAINKKNKCLVLAPITFIFMWWMASAALMWCIMLATLLACCHGVMHTAPAHMKAIAQQEVQAATGRLPTHDNSIPNIDPLDTNAVDEEWWDLQ